jgi:hypothetical protein
MVPGRAEQAALNVSKPRHDVRISLDPIGRIAGPLLRQTRHPPAFG